MESDNKPNYKSLYKEMKFMYKEIKKKNLN